MRSRRLKRITRKWQFIKLFRKGGYFKGNVLKARYLKNSLGQIRLGFSVSAKRGNAVHRNLFKRRLRQYSVEKVTVQGFDAVIFPLKQLTEVKWSAVLDDMEKLVEAASGNE